MQQVTKNITDIVEGAAATGRFASPRIIAVTSGKGGVGKTNTSLNLAIALSRLKKRVCIFDADMGLANINILLGINPELTIQDVISGPEKLKDIIVNTHEGIQVIPGSSGIQWLAELNKAQLEELISGFDRLSQRIDFLIIDTSSGISSNVTSFVMAAQEAIVLATKEPTSLIDAYGLIKVITSMGHRKPIHILINMVSSAELGKKIFRKLFEAARKNLNIDLKYLGTILMDKRFPEAVCNQKPLLLSYPNSLTGKTYISLANIICDHPVDKTIPRETFKNFWNQILGILKNPVIKNGKNSAPIKTTTSQRNIIAHKRSGENKLEGVILKILSMVNDGRFDIGAFLEFNESERSYFEKLDSFVDQYNQFAEMTLIAGNGKYFKELDFEKYLTLQEKI